MIKSKSQADAQKKPVKASTTQKQPEAPEKQIGPFHAVQMLATALPPPNGKPAAARAANMMAEPEQGLSTLQRARMMGGIQRTVGNARLSRMVQTKLTVGAPNDIHEQEADRVADQVMRMPEPPVAKQKESRANAPELSKMGLCPECEKKLQQAQTDGITRPKLCPACEKSLQRQIQEDDRPALDVKDQIQQRTDAGQFADLGLQEEVTDPREASAATVNASVQRMVHLQGTEEQTLQTKHASTQTPEVTPAIASYIHSSKGGGQPLTGDVRRQMEGKFGADFGSVNVHTDAESDRVNRQLGARAFTVGPDIHFKRGEYEPGNPDGQKLLAHELTHVVQQRKGDIGSAESEISSKPVYSVGHSPIRIQRNATSQSITPAYAQALNDRSLSQEIQQLENIFSTLPESNEEHLALRENLHILRNEQMVRNRSTNRDNFVPRPSGLPMDQSYMLRPLPTEMEKWFADVPEGQFITVSLLSTGQTPTDAGQTTETFGPTAMTSPVSGGALAMLRSIDAGLMQAGFASAGADAIGLVGIPRWFTPGARIPESLSSWGHTAVYVRQGGRITLVRGFTVESMLTTLRNARAIEGGLASTPARIANDARLFTRTGAMSIEYPVTADLAENIVSHLPTTGRPTGTTPTAYTARPAIRCVGTNCVLWAVGKAESTLGGPIGPRTSGASVSAIGEGGSIVEGTASQGRLLRFMQATSEASEHATVPPRATGSAVAGGMSRGMQVLKWGGRVMLVVGVVMIPVEVAMAPEEEHTRTAIGATGGFLGGLAGGAALGLACGPGAPVCSVVAGLAGGLLGYYGGRGVAESIYDVATDRTLPSVSNSSL